MTTKTVKNEKKSETKTRTVKEKAPKVEEEKDTFTSGFWKDIDALNQADMEEVLPRGSHKAISMGCTCSASVETKNCPVHGMWRSYIVVKTHFKKKEDSIVSVPHYREICFFSLIKDAFPFWKSAGLHVETLIFERNNTIFRELDSYDKRRMREFAAKEAPKAN